MATRPHIQKKVLSYKVEIPPLKVLGIPLWLLYDFLGIRFIWEKILPPKDTDRPKRKPSTFLLWISGIYVALFGITTQLYESRIDTIENRANAIIAQLSQTNYKALEMIPRVQEMSSPEKPKILEPLTVFRSLWGKKTQCYYEIIDLLKETIENLKTELKGLDLSEVYLKDARLKGANLEEAILINANLKNANLDEAKLMRANLSGAKLGVGYSRYESSGGIMEGGMDGTKLSRADLTGAKLEGTDLTGVIMNGAVLQGAILKYADLRQAVIKKGDLSKASLRKAKLNEAIFVEAALRHADLREAILSQTDLSGVDLSGADLSGADLLRANLSGADLSGATLTGAKGLTVDQLLKVESLDEVKDLEPKIAKELKLRIESAINYSIFVFAIISKYHSVLKII